MEQNGKYHGPENSNRISYFPHPGHRCIPDQHIPQGATSHGSNKCDDYHSEKVQFLVHGHQNAGNGKGNGTEKIANEIEQTLNN